MSKRLRKEIAPKQPLIKNRVRRENLTILMVACSLLSVSWLMAAKATAQSCDVILYHSSNQAYPFSLRGVILDRDLKELYGYTYPRTSYPHSSFEIVELHLEPASRQVKNSVVGHAANHTGVSYSEVASCFFGPGKKGGRFSPTENIYSPGDCLCLSDRLDAEAVALKLSEEHKKFYNEQIEKTLHTIRRETIITFGTYVDMLNAQMRSLELQEATLSETKTALVEREDAVTEYRKQLQELGQRIETLKQSLNSADPAK